MRGFKIRGRAQETEGVRWELRSFHLAVSANPTLHPLEDSVLILINTCSPLFQPRWGMACFHQVIQIRPERSCLSALILFTPYLFVPPATCFSTNEFWKEAKHLYFLSVRPLGAINHLKRFSENKTKYCGCRGAKVFWGQNRNCTLFNCWEKQTYVHYL